MTDTYRDWDAAYMLGSLSSTERREYEAHLRTCPDCSASVADLAVLPGLLSRVSASDIEQNIEHVEVPPTILPRLVAATRRRHVRTLTIGLTAVAAAAAITAALAIPQLLPPDSGRQTVEVALSQAVPSPLSADIRLVEHQWGTSIDMTCRYATGANSYDGEATYGMYVTDLAGHTTQLSTWTAGPGSTVEPTGTTSLSLSDIRSIDVRAIDSATILLTGTP